MPIHESGENYLEQILMLSKQKERVRAIDLCTALGFSRPTVSVMLRDLRAKGYVTQSENGGLALTESGLTLATRIYERHCIIADALIKLGVPHDVALQDACKMEHDLSDVTVSCIKSFLKKD